MFVEIISTTLLFTAAFQAQISPEFALSRDDVLPAHAFLVKAHAITSKVFEIDHVYVGDAGLKGKKFSGELRYQNGFNFNGMYEQVILPIKKDTPGIWWIKMDKAKLIPVHEQLSAVMKRTEDGSVVAVKGQFHYPDNLVFLPALDDGSQSGHARYEMAITKAQVFEKIYRADDKSRLKVIDDCVRSRDSVPGAAALMSLAWINTPQKGVREGSGKHTRIADYVLPFSKDDSLSPRVQRQVERLLVANAEGFWKGSTEEKKMLLRWFMEPWKEKESMPWEVSEECVLVEFMDSRPLDSQGRMELAVGGLANSLRSERFKDELIARLKVIESGVRRADPKQDEKGYAHLVGILRSDVSTSKRLAAAKLLTVYAPFSPQRRATLETITRGMKADDVWREMVRMLEKN